MLCMLLSRASHHDDGVFEPLRLGCSTLMAFTDRATVDVAAVATISDNTIFNAVMVVIVVAVMCHTSIAERSS
jgi:hypothetical protein